MREVTLLFDFDGTLVRLDKLGAYSQVVAEHGRGDTSGLAEDLCRLDNEQCAAGMPDRYPIFKKFADRFKAGRVEDLCVAFWERMTQGQTLQPDCLWTLDMLAAKGYVLVCVTDTDGTGSNKRQRIHAALPRHFPEDRVFIGRENIPYGKDPTTRYMEAVVARLRANPARCIMIGDKVEIDLIPAQAVGMQTILMKNERYPGTWDPQIERLSELVPLVRNLEIQPALGRPTL